MYYNFTKKELKLKNGTDFNSKDTINITDSHFEIWIDFGNYQRPSLCSKVMDINTGKFQDVVFRPDYIRNFLHR